MKSSIAICVLSFVLMTSASPILGPVADTVLGTAANALNTVTGTASGLIGGALNTFGNVAKSAGGSGIIGSAFSAVGDVAKGAASLEFAKGRAMQSAVNGIAGLGSNVLGTGALNGPTMNGPGDFGGPGPYMTTNSRGYEASASTGSQSFDSSHSQFSGGPGGIQGSSSSSSGTMSNVQTRSMGYDDSSQYGYY